MPLSMYKEPVVNTVLLFLQTVRSDAKPTASLLRIAAYVLM